MTRATSHARRSRAAAILAAAALTFTGLTSLGTAAHAADDDAVAIVDTDATAPTRSLFQYLRDQESGGVLFGQQHPVDESVSAAAPGPDGQPVKSDVHDVTGDLPGVFGFDGLALKGDEKPGSHDNTDEQNAAALAEQFVRADALGGIVTLSAHMPNFVTGKDFYDTSGRVVSHILPGGDKNADFRAYLDLVALAATDAERDDGSLVPIVFRPFHENTGSWFWWGAAHATTGEYKEIFRYTVEYLRDVKGVHNLLYAFSPNGSFDGDSARYLETYPGDQWVDVLGYDNYENSNADDDSSAYVDAVVTDLDMVVDLAAARHKIPAFTEFGRNGDRTIKPSGNKSLHYYTELMDGLNASPKASKVAWMLTWANFGSGQIYVPYAGHEMASDFQALYDDPRSIFASQTGDPYSSDPPAAAQQPFLRLVTPADGTRITTPTVTVRAKLTAAPGVDSVTFTADGFDPVGLTKDDDGYWSGTWDIGADALTNRTVGATVTATGGGHDLTSSVSVILGAAPVLPEGTVDDFEGYGDDVALRAAYTVANATSSALALGEHGDGNAAKLSYDFPASRTGYLGFGKSFAPTQNWSAFGQLDLWIDPDASGHKLVVQVQAGGVTFEAYPSLAVDDSYVAHIPWTEFKPAPWDAANAGATLTWERLAKVSQFFVYLNDAGGDAPLKGSILVDDIKASGEGEYVDPEPTADPIVVDDFEGYADEAAFDEAWGNRGKTDLISLGTDAGQGAQALSFSYDNANGGWQDVSRWLGQDWSGRDALSLRVKGDGSSNQLAIQISNTTGSYWLAQVPLTDTSWHTVEIPFSSFAPSWPADLTDPLDDRQLGSIGELVLASNSTSGSGTFGVDDIQAVGGEPAPEVPDGSAEVLDTFDTYATTTDLRAGWSNIAEQDWGDGWQLALAPGKGSAGSKAAQFVYDFGSTTYLQESRWLGGHSWAGLDGITAWIDPNGSGQSVSFRFRTPSADGTGDDWYWDLPVPLTGTAHTVRLAFDDAVVTYPSGISSTLRPTRAQLAGVNEFIIMATQADASLPKTGSFYLDDIAVGDFAAAPADVAPTVTQQPAAASGTLGESVTLTAAASGSPEPAVQWQSQAKGSSSWADVSGATSASLVVTLSTAVNGTSYRAVFTNAAGTATTDAATVTLKAAKPVVTTQPRPVSGKLGAIVKVKAAATGYPEPTKVRWELQRKGSTTWTKIPLATSSTLTLVLIPALDGAQVRAVFTSTAGSTASDPATVTVTGIAPVIVGQPSAQTVKKGSRATFTVTALGYPAPTYQWYRQDGDTWVKVAGATSASYSVTATTAADYRVIVSNAAGSVTSKAASLRLR